MELRTVDPRTLKPNPHNPRRIAAGEHPDAQLVANIQAVGILQPPVMREEGKALVVVAGHRRVQAAIAAGMPEILVLVREADNGSDAACALSENVVRAQMGPVDQWRSIETLVSAEWTEEAIATALALPVRTLRKLRLLAQILPGMLDQMALGDMPGEQQLRVIAAASPNEQAAVWKKHRPKKGQPALWHDIARALTKRTLPAKAAKFDDDLAQAYGIVWTEDLFSPAGEDARTTTQVEAFLAAQNEWLAANLPEGGELAELDQYGRPKLPPRAMQHYGKPRRGDRVACYVDARTGEVDQVVYSMAEPRRSTGKGEEAKPAPKPRPDITAKGVAMIGDLRTDALHQALREAPIGDDVLIGLLVLGLGGRNVQVHSGAERRGYGWRERIAERLTEGGVLTQDLDVLRAAAREMLVEVLSYRENNSQSGMGARHAGAAIGADAYLPNMATQEFLSCLSKQAMQGTASAKGVAPRNTGKETRAALIAQVGQGRFVHPAALFPPTAKELQARRKPSSLVASATRDEYEQRLQVLARAAADAGGNWQRQVQLRRQFDAVADRIGLASGKRAWLLAAARWARRSNAPPTMADLWVESVASPSCFARPRPQDFDPDPRIRRRRVPLSPHVRADPCLIPNMLHALRAASLKARITRLGDPPWDRGHVQVEMPLKGRSRFVAMAERDGMGRMQWRAVWDGNHSEAGLRRYRRALQCDAYARMAEVLRRGRLGVQGDLFCLLP